MRRNNLYSYFVRRKKISYITLLRIKVISGITLLRIIWVYDDENNYFEVEMSVT